ncbi:hypothetical protein [Marinilabilia salmonicolor]|jgi:hypothetical protein|uniref:Uncharacterized protein n=1 Tax=Marinilabilia salmonicolor TaxID=989 RepID=A0A2T0WTI0_9BACT|nr:hypothetical protein [Marinilabilia salmonicolor]PRY90003.1 hypothetical protein BY457_12810 [Marinilabilia salmonicolor]RCW28836.1 hypothetical protein DFO77_13519 [Marinilabilia salmonicolor]
MKRKRKKNTKESLYREITHHHRVGTSTKGYLPHEIKEMPAFAFDPDKHDRFYVDEDIWESPALPKLGAKIMMGVFLIFILIFLTSENEWIFFETLLFIGSCIGFLVSVVYYFTMPKKEMIFDRKRGVVTLPGTMWAKSFTMEFYKVDFTFSTGGHNGIGAYQLRYLGPKTLGAIGFGGDCYQDLSYLTWYMDRNRPLPPGSMFDAFRERDFQRRKAEGFPPPLYPSKIPTPEATPEQQKERNRYWYDEHYRNFGTNMEKRKKLVPAERWINRIKSS